MWMLTRTCKYTTPASKQDNFKENGKNGPFQIQSMHASSKKKNINKHYLKVTEFNFSPSPVPGGPNSTQGTGRDCPCKIRVTASFCLLLSLELKNCKAPSPMHCPLVTPGLVSDLLLGVLCSCEGRGETMEGNKTESRSLASK